MQGWPKPRLAGCDFAVKKCQRWVAMMVASWDKYWSVVALRTRLFGIRRVRWAVQRKSSGFKSLLTSYSEAAWLSYKPLSKPNKQLLDRLAHLHPSSHGLWVKRSSCCRPNGTACPSQ